LSEGSMDEKVFAKWDNQWKHCKNYFWKINLNFAVILIKIDYLNYGFSKSLF